MVQAGFSPSVRLFEAAACGVPIITDTWPGLDSIFRLQSEILPAINAADVTSYLQMPLDRILEVAERARCRTLRFHTAAVRAEEFESYVLESIDRLSGSKIRTSALTYVAQ
jgi:spore maturation protein CgeB